MKIEYKLLENSKEGFLLTRNADVVYDDLDVIIKFIGAPVDATAIFEIGEDSYYRKLVDNSCSLPSIKLNGVVKVTVAVLNHSARPLKFKCEEFIAKTQANGGVLITPNDMNLPQNVVKIRLEIEEINKKYIDLLRKYQDLEKRIEDIMEGYDII